MRVISGTYRGKKLVSPSNERVRPTTDRVKENIFNMIQFETPGSAFLDLFAGSGAMGIEAISRGARLAVFCDQDRESIRIIRTNLEWVKESAEVIQADYENALRLLKGRAFDLIYLDPPYPLECLPRVLELVEQYNLLSEAGTVVYEFSAEKTLVAPEGYQIVKQKRYGTVGVVCLKKVEL